jgi:carbamoylphosphate synthase large subunit
MKAEIMLQIEDEMAACIHARSAINLHQIGEIKIAFQIYGNALNSKSVKSLEAKERINALLPTLDSKTAIWLVNFLPES